MPDHSLCSWTLSTAPRSTFALVLPLFQSTTVLLSPLPKWTLPCLRSDYWDQTGFLQETPRGFFNECSVGCRVCFRKAVIPSSFLGGCHSIVCTESLPFPAHFATGVSHITPLLCSPHLYFHPEAFNGSTLIHQALPFLHHDEVRQLNIDRSDFITGTSPSYVAQAMVFLGIKFGFRRQFHLSPFGPLPVIHPTFAGFHSWTKKSVAGSWTPNVWLSLFPYSRASRISSSERCSSHVRCTHPATHSLPQRLVRRLNPFPSPANAITQKIEHLNERQIPARSPCIPLSQSFRLHLCFCSSTTRNILPSREHGQGRH